jgi:putative endonuclease
MPAKAEHLLLGVVGEEAAARHVEGLGWTLLARNWRPEGFARCLELDLVARHKNSLIFIEVKTRKRKAPPAGPGFCSGKWRRAEDAFPAYAAFTARKQRTLLRAAGHYLTAHDCWHLPCRFDLICVEQTPDGDPKLEHFSNVLSFRNIMDSRNASWQPW